MLCQGAENRAMTTRRGSRKMGRPTGKRSRMAMGIGNESNDSSVKECQPRQWGRRKRGESLEMRSGSLGETVGTGGMPFVERTDWRGGSEEKKRMMMILLYGVERERERERERGRPSAAFRGGSRARVLLLSPLSLSTLSSLSALHPAHGAHLCISS